MSTYYSNSPRTATARRNQQFRTPREEPAPRQDRQTRPTSYGQQTQAMEIDNYNFKPELHNQLDLRTLKDTYPALPNGQREVFGLDGHVIEFNTHAIKIRVSNLFKDDRVDDPYESLVSDFQQVSSLFTRKFARALDYSLPPMRMELFDELSDGPRIMDRFFVSSKQSEMYLTFSEAGSQHVEQITFYNVYRSFIPLIDVSNSNDINLSAILKVYNSILVAEMKVCQDKGARPTPADFANVEGLTQLANFFYNESKEGADIPYAIAKALLFQRLSSVGNFLIDNTSFIQPDDLDFYNDELDGIEKRDYKAYLEHLKDAEVHEDEKALRDLCVRVVENIMDYKSQKISCLTYDSNYRKLLMTYLSSIYCGEDAQNARRSVYVPSSEMTEEKRIKLIFNAMPEADEGNPYNVKEETEATILGANQSIVIGTIIGIIQHHERAGVSVFPLIRKHFQDRPEFIDALRSLNCSHRNDDGITALANLFKLAAFTGNSTIFDIFMSMNQMRAKDMKTDIYNSIAENYDVVKRDKLFEMIRTVYRLEYPSAIVNFVSSAMRFYTQQGEGGIRKSTFIGILLETMRPRALRQEPRVERNIPTQNRTYKKNTCGSRRGRR